MSLHLLEARLSADQETITLEDKYEISATVVDSAQLQWWLQVWNRFSYRKMWLGLREGGDI